MFWLAKDRCPGERAFCDVSESPNWSLPRPQCHSHCCSMRGAVGLWITRGKWSQNAEIFQVSQSGMVAPWFHLGKPHLSGCREIALREISGSQCIFSIFFLRCVNSPFLSAQVSLRAKYIQWIPIFLDFASVGELSLLPF